MVFNKRKKSALSPLIFENGFLSRRDGKPLVITRYGETGALVKRRANGVLIVQMDNHPFENDPLWWHQDEAFVSGEQWVALTDLELR